MITKNKIKYIKNKALSIKKIHITNNPELITKYLGIEILYRKYKKQMGAFIIINKTPFIFLKEDLSYEEKQIVLAHEIGHFILHKKLLKDIFILRDFSLFSKRENEIEKEANIFASYLLIDEKQLIELKKQNLSAKEISKALKININLINAIES